MTEGPRARRTVERIAEGVERAAGPRAALLLARRVVAMAWQPALREAALLAGMRAALAAGDPVSFATFASEWPTASDAEVPEVSALVRAADRRGWPGEATLLAAAEARRRPRGLSLYAWAERLVVAKATEAEHLLADAASRAEADGDVACARRASVRRALLISADLARLDEAVGVAQGVQPSGASAGERLGLARVLLRAGSRFVRAGAIDTLDPVVSGSDRRLSDAALVLLGQHVDRAAGGVSLLELERIRAVFGRPEVAARTHRARAALDDAHALAEASRRVRVGGGEEALLLRAAETDEPTRMRLLASAEARGDWHEVTRLLDAFRRSEDAPEGMLTVVTRVLVRGDGPARGAAAAAAEHAIAALPDTLGVDLVLLGRALEGAGFDAPALSVLRRAVCARSPDAHEALAGCLRRSARRCAPVARPRAIALLREDLRLRG